eukprot:325072-Alexandrium_andersonii.AAC.1
MPEPPAQPLRSHGPPRWGPAARPTGLGSASMKPLPADELWRAAERGSAEPRSATMNVHGSAFSAQRT